MLISRSASGNLRYSGLAVMWLGGWPMLVESESGTQSCYVSYGTGNKTLQSGLSWWFSGKESACQCRRHRRCVFDPWAGKMPWRREWLPIPVFLPGESHRGAWWASVHGVAKSQTWLSHWACMLSRVSQESKSTVWIMGQEIRPYTGHSVCTGGQVGACR